MYKIINLAIILIIIGLLLNPLRGDSYQGPVDNNVLKEAFEKSGAIFKDIKIINWVRYKDLKDYQFAVANLKDNVNKVKESKDYNSRITIYPQNRYIVKEILSSNIGLDITRFNKKVLSNKEKETVETYNSKIFEGYYNKLISKKEMERISVEIKNYLNIKRIESNSDKHLYVLNGYTPLITDYISIYDNKYNINIAFRTNKKEGKTYFYVGSPIISIEY